MNTVADRIRRADPHQRLRGHRTVVGQEAVELGTGAAQPVEGVEQDVVGHPASVRAAKQSGRVTAPNPGRGVRAGPPATGAGGVGTIRSRSVTFGGRVHCLPGRRASIVHTGRAEAPGQSEDR